MPYIEKSIKDLDITVTRQVMLSVISSVLKHTAVRSPEDVKIAYLGDSQVELESGSYLDAKDKDPVVKYSDYGKVTIEVTEEENPDFILAMSSNRENEQPLIEHKRLGLVIKPDYSVKTVTIDFKYRASTENAANDWANNILRRLNQTISYLPHEIDYTILLNAEFLSLCYEIYQKQEAVAGLGIEFKDWFDGVTKVPYQVQATLDGDETAISFSQVAATIFGSFDIAKKPEIRRNAENNTYETSLSYTFEYNKPHSLIAKYPLVVHNQILDPIWINTNALYDSSKFPGYRSSVQKHFEGVLKRNRMHSKYEAIVNPHFDDWNAEKRVDAMSLVFRTMCQVKPDALDTLIDLNNLGKFKLTDKYLEQIAKYPEKVVKRRQWFIYLAVYEDDILLPDSAMWVDENHVVRMTKPMDLRKTYRFCIYFLTDYSALNELTINAMLKEPDYFYYSVTTLDPTLLERNIKPDTYGQGRFLKLSSFEHIVKHINRATLIDNRFFNRVAVYMNRILIEV
jgi:hypothetical protein